jgi:hypothetical protein
LQLARLVAAVAELWTLGRFFMRIEIATIIAVLALLTGCQESHFGATPAEPASKFEPAWLSKSDQIVYSSQDETIQVKAKVTEAEYIEAAKTLQLIPYTEDKGFAENIGRLQWKAGPDKRWDPSSKLEGTLICHRDILWEVVKYENGFLYYEMFNLDH